MTIFEVSLFGLHIGPTWYGLMYALGFLFCYLFLRKEGFMKEEHLDTLLIYIFLGVVIGGRVGYVLLYDFSYFLESPSKIIEIWKGGMSFHGGAIGVILSLIIFSWKYRYPLYSISDRLVIILPLALGLGRIGNYINNELPGYTPYDGPLAMIIDSIRYFPSPLFQAFLEGVILLIILQLFRYFSKLYKPGNGISSALFLTLYGLLRIIAEHFRLPDSHIGYLFGTDWITLGMLYSIPMILLGCIIFFMNFPKKTR